MRWRTGAWIAVVAAITCFVSCVGVMFLSDIAPAPTQMPPPGPTTPTPPVAPWLLGALSIAIPAGLFAVLVFLIARRFGGRGGSAGRCPHCDYDLRGTNMQGCPECGWGRHDRPAKADR
jgi:hypothetical protein